ncbi:MAG: type II secretion system minor pseudopilin GspJ [Gammaproteobacteria bacterium]|nr:type II secretion system minor pseudopilin GspJ [Gammaproteobacteria bacterium]
MTCIAPRKTTAGFTLIELLVAMTIFGIISALALGGLNAIVTQQTIAKAQMERLASLQRTLRVMTEDFAQLNPRPVRDILGQSTEAALITSPGDENLLRLSRSGWRNFAQVRRGTLQRVQYRIEEDVLLREYWPVMDYPLGMEPRQQELIDGISDLEIEYLDDQSQWQAQWPPLNQTGGAPDTYPRAIRITMTLSDWGEIERLVDLLP